MKEACYSASAFAGKCSSKGYFLLCFALLATRASGQGTAITPSSGFTNAYRFEYTGANQTFTVPAGVTSISVKIWGAGGGGSNANGFYSTGGAGGYVSGTLSVVPGTTYSIMVGGGGRSDGSATWTTHSYGFGGIAAGPSIGSDGGGLSGLFTGNTAVAVTDMARAIMIAGGGGGGEDGNTTGTLLSNGGQGGDPTHSGGKATMAGGDNSTGSGGGGGGGGYQGGNTNLSRLSNSSVTMGEGGSNYLAPAVTSGVNSATADLGLVFTPSAGANPPNSSDPQYVSGVGKGTTTTSGLGGDGLAIIQYFIAPLPLTLISFTATAGENYALLSWETANEKDMYGFQAERSTDGVNYVPVSSDIPAGSPLHAYSFRDQFPSSGADFYRLKISDLAGSFTYSKTVKLSFSDIQSSVFQIFPNPASNTITLQGLDEGMEARIFSADGHLVRQLKTPCTEVNIAALQAGLYFIEISERGHTYYRTKFIKQ